MPHGGRLTIGVEEVELTSGVFGPGIDVTPGPFVLLTVADTGVGMNNETKSRIFEPFFSTKPFGKGTGLGLAVVYGIIKQSGGFIFADSEVGRGTRFRLYLRSAQPAQPTETALGLGERRAAHRARCGRRGRDPSVESQNFAPATLRRARGIEWTKRA
jgi:two-component system cell cycle sensor histidine kinase/response regulator CckA